MILCVNAIMEDIIIDNASDESGEGSGEEEEDDDDDDGWITPSNIKKHKMKSGLLVDEKEQEEEDILVACMTVDFALQVRHRNSSISRAGKHVHMNTCWCAWS